MKLLGIIFAGFLLLVAPIYAQTVGKNVQKATDGTNHITEDLNLGSGRTLTAESGSNVDFSRANLTGILGEAPTDGAIYGRQAGVYTGITDTTGVILPGKLPAWTGENFIMVQTAAGSTAPTTNGTSLLAALTTAISKITAGIALSTNGPNGLAPSQSNPVVIILPPGLYDLGTSDLNITAPYIIITGLVGGAGQVPVITTADVTDGHGLLTINHATNNGTVFVNNVVLQGTGAATANATSATGTNDHFSIVRFVGSATQTKNTQFKGVEFRITNTGNVFNAGCLLTTANVVFDRCAFPSAVPISYTSNVGATFINCQSGSLPTSAPKLALVGDATTQISFTGFVSSGTTLNLTDIKYNPAVSPVGLKIVLDGAAGFSAIPATAGVTIFSCDITFKNSGVASTANSVAGAYVGCNVSLFAGITGVLGTSTFESCVISNGASSTLTVAASSYPKFYQCRFLNPLPLAASGVIDLQHSILPSTWGTPANLLYTTGNGTSTSTLPTSNTISPGTNWDTTP